MTIAVRGTAPLDVLASLALTLKDVPKQDQTLNMLRLMHFLNPRWYCQSVLILHGTVFFVLSDYDTKHVKHYQKKESAFVKEISDLNETLEQWLIWVAIYIKAEDR